MTDDECGDFYKYRQIFCRIPVPGGDMLVVMTANDLDLLRQFSREHAQDAFTALVQRHVNLVYSAALRQVRSPQLAEEVAQSVFTDLAQNADKLAGEPGDAPVLTAWLYTVTRRTAVDVIRKESRRQLREQIAYEMNAMNADAADWNQIEPLLDDAMAALDETDRAAVLLRYFENKSLREVGEALETNDDAAQKRVSRAVERLREFFAKRGITVGAGGLVVVISANAVQAAPVGLAVTISAAALAGTAATTFSLIAATTKTIAMTTLQKTLVTATVAVLAGAGIYEAKQAHDAQRENSRLRAEQAPLADDIAKLRAENEKLSSVVAEAKNQQKLTQSQFSELLKLRGQAGQAKTAMQELAKAQAALKKQKSAMPGSLAAAMALSSQRSIASEKEKAAARVAQMKTALNLSDAQVQSITDIMFTHIDRRNEMFQQDISNGNITSITNGDGVITQMGHSGENVETQEDEIKAQLSPDQVAEYDAFKKGEEASVQERAVSSEAAAIATEFSLTPEQQQQIQEQMAQSGLDTTGRISTTDTNLAAAWLATGDQSIIAQIAMKQSLERLTNRLNLLQSVLTPAQLEKYRQEQQAQIEAMKDSMSIFTPQPNGAPPQ